MNHSICGWTGSAQSRNDLATTLGRMCRHLSLQDDSQCHIHTEEMTGIAVAGPDSAQQLTIDGRLIVAFSGTPYWSSRELADLGRQTGLATTLAKAYRRHGKDFLKLLSGPFSLALVDIERNEALIAVDRMGICQMSYAHRPDAGLIFGSNATCLQAHDDFRTSVNRQAIFEYMYFHMVPSPGSIYDNQYKLRAGECLSLRNGSVELGRYWSPDFAEAGQSGRSALSIELKDRLRDSVKRCVSGNQTGCFLSGGLDSSTVAGFLSEFQSPAKSFTIGFQEKGYDETEFARIAAGHFGTEQFEYCVSPADVVDILPKIADAYDEPFGNSSVVPTYYCARLARENGIHTMLAGDGGDELFGGNVRYVTQQVFGIYEKLPGWLKTGIIEPVSFSTPGANKFYPTRKLQSYIRQATEPMPDRLQTYNYFSLAPVHDILHPDFLDSINAEGPIDLLRDSYRSSKATSMLNRMLELDWKFTLADNDLRKVNRMCELSGIEVRYPMLDDDLVEFSTRVPPGMKIHLFRLRHFFKHAMKDFLPPNILRKSKHGFGLPFGVWMKSYRPLRDLAYDNLTDFKKRDFVRRDYLDQLIRSHDSVHAHYYGEFIWVLMMLELWLKKHDDGNG